MKLKILLIAVLTTVGLTGCGSRQHSVHNDKVKLPEQELHTLSDAIVHYPKYLLEKQEKIDLVVDSLRQADSDNEKWRLALDLSVIYRSFDTDSALYYSYRASQYAETLNDDAKNQATIALINAFSTAGLFTEANTLFNGIDPSKLPADIKIKYWTAGRILFGYMKSYAQGNSMFENKYNERYIQFDDSLLKHLPKNHPFREFIACERLVAEGKYSSAETQLNALLKILPETSNLYAMSAFQLAEVYRNYNNEEKYAAMLTMSATSDVKNCIKEGLALPALAYWLYEQGAHSEAFRYINFALEEVSEASTRMRAATMAQFAHVIDKAYREKIDHSTNLIVFFLIIVTILLFVTALLSMFLWRQSRKSKENEQKIASIADRQKSYIGSFIELYSTYADRLNRLTKLIDMKLATGQTAELKKLLESGKFSDQDNDDIHNVFDNAFLDIYPEFIDNLNRLLKEDQKIEIRESATLTPELRIYALVLLGIDESHKIARILHYSPNTVYAYRNKMRNKAINRDTFDADVAAMGKALR